MNLPPNNLSLMIDKINPNIFSNSNNFQQWGDICTVNNKYENLDKTVKNVNVNNWDYSSNSELNPNMSSNRISNKEKDYLSLNEMSCSEMSQVVIYLLYNLY